MLSKLPGWVIDDAASVRAEVAEWKGLTALELWRLAHGCARDVMWAARIGGHRQRVLDQVDPLSADTVAALARLRRRASASRDVR